MPEQAVPSRGKLTASRRGLLQAGGIAIAGLGGPLLTPAGALAATTGSDLPPLTPEQLSALRRERLSRRRHGPGKSPCIVTIDMQQFFLKQGDPAATASAQGAATLLDLGRAAGLPIFMVRIVYDKVEEINPAQRARFLEASRPLFRGGPLTEFHPLVAPKKGDIVVEKKHASGFAGSRLKAEMDARGIDTVYLAGTSTSGCIRATAVEGAALGLRMILVEEALHEPRPISGPVALAELADRYADVIRLDEARVQIGTRKA